MPLPREPRLLARLGALFLWTAACDPSSGFSVSGGDEEELPDDPDAWPDAAPDGYFVHGNTIYDSMGNPHVFRGVARPSLEWNSEGEHLSADDYQLMGDWNANVVRIALNQAFWLEDAVRYDPTYAARIDENIEWAQAAGMDVILDLHWSDGGEPDGFNEQWRMADARSIEFWKSVAARYKDNGRVLFELYNEPHDVPWRVWRDGGLTGSAEDEEQGLFQAVGMQDLYDAVRSTGAHNVVVIGGLDWGFSLALVPEYRIEGYNIAYAAHPYDYMNKQSETWDTAFGDLSETDPIILTEFGDFNCSGDYYREVIAYAEEHGLSWTAWAWYPGSCQFPAIIDDWEGNPSTAGVGVREALLKYNP